MRRLPRAINELGVRKFFLSNILMRSFLLILLSIGFIPNIVWAETYLEAIDFSVLPGDKVQINLQLSGKASEPASFTTDNPSRISLDFMGVKSSLGYKTKLIGVGSAHSVTALEAGNRTRVVINLTDSVAHDIKVIDDKVEVSLGGDRQESSTVKNTLSITENESQDVSELPVSNVTDISSIDFRRGREGEGRVLVTLNNPAIPVDVREEGGRIVVEFFKASINPNLLQSLDVVDFATPITLVETKRSGENTRIEISPAGEYDYLAYQANEVFAVEVRALTKQEKEALQKERMVFTGEKLSLNFQDIEVRSVLQLLADFTGLNLVTSDTVSGRITLRLKNVPWDQALDIILKSKGLSKRQTDNVIMVAPTEEIAAREQLELESQKKIEELAPLRSEFIQVNYAKAENLANLFKSDENRLLSDRGNVTVDVRTNTLLIQDTAAKLNDIRRLLKKLDIPVRQVLIESRIVIANNDFARELGVRFGINGDYDIGDSFGLTAGGLPGHTGGTAGIAPGIENPAGSSNEALMVNLPVSNASGAVNFLVGKVGTYLLQLELSAMQREGKGEIISSPRVITSDQNKASIKQGFEIPYQEASSSGATSVSFKEAVLKLEVTPQITPDDRIRMDLEINKDSPDYSRVLNDIPPIDTRKIETTVLVDNGETVVLGGVFERTKTDSMEKVPFFGDIPYIGVLFRNNEKVDENKELLIFVTPKILKESLSVR
ncbi:MAG: type IV pilus secretin PilQ [Gammaproteobacteria bacterium]|nr:type IV pilus secretin PilQ [Gammaproteobacteria bacterium]